MYFKRLRVSLRVEMKFYTPPQDGVVRLNLPFCVSLRSLGWLCGTICGFGGWEDPEGVDGRREGDWRMHHYGLLP